MESTPCNSSHCYLLYTHMSDMKRVELTGQLALQTQLQTSSQHFSYLIQVSLLWKQYLRHKRTVQLLKCLQCNLIYFTMGFSNNVSNTTFSDTKSNSHIEMSKEWSYFHIYEYSSCSTAPSFLCLKHTCTHTYNTSFKTI